MSRHVFLEAERQTRSEPDFYAAAKRYIAQGLRLVPVHYPDSAGCSCGRPDCGTQGKHPKPSRWTEATYPAEEWATGRVQNLGIITGAPSGIVVIDVDAGGEDTLTALEQEHGLLPVTVQARTGGAGRHILFRHPGVEIRNDVKRRIGPGVDVRGDGGLIVAPPSLHRSGNRYEWIEGHSPGQVPLAELPKWLLDRLRMSERDSCAAPLPAYQPAGDDIYRRASAYLERVPPAVSGSGGHNQTWHAATNVVRGFALDEETAFQLLSAEYNPRCQPPWSERDLRHKIREAIHKATRPPWGYLLTSDRPLSSAHAPRSKTKAANAPSTEAAAAADDSEPEPEPVPTQEMGPGDAEAPEPEADHGKAKGAKALVQLVEEANVETFTDDRGEVHAAIPLPSGSHQVVRLSSPSFKSWLAYQLYKDSGTVAGKEAKDNAVALIEAAAKERAERRTLGERFAFDGKPAHTIWVDLGDEAWSAVRIQSSGWEVVRGEAAPVLFRRGVHVAALPEPAKDAPLLEAMLFKYINVEEQGDRLLVLAWLVAVFFSGVPRPILHFAGPKGAAKTTSARVLRRITDPSLAPVLGAPTKKEELAHQLAKHAVPVYDNMSSIPSWLSDAYCRAVTGEAWERRSLYTNDESVIVSYRRPIILTGINLSSTAPDLLDRVLWVELAAVRERRTEAEVWRTFEAEATQLLGALYDLVAATLARLPQIQADQRFRMADFAHVGAAVAVAMGKTAEDFSVAYARTLGAQTTEILEAAPLAVALRTFMAETRNHTAANEWDGKVGDLWERLRPKGPDERHNTFPKSAAAMSKKLRELLHALADAGLEVKPYDGEKKERRVLVRRRDP